MSVRVKYVKNSSLDSFRKEPGFYQNELLTNQAVIKLTSLLE